VTEATDVAALRRVARQALAGDEAAQEADLLIAHALGRSRAWLFAHGEHVPDGAQRAEIVRLLDARASGVPIAQLTGKRGFWSFELGVNQYTLIPRPETELLVELALARLPLGVGLAVADMGTGTGAIALALASERPLLRMIATDASADALAVARANAQSLGVGNIEFRHGDWCAALEDDVLLDMIVSNPPYLGEDDEHVQKGDLRFEPRSALVSGSDGLDAIRQISRQAQHYLAPGGWLLMEHGKSQGAAVRQCLSDAGYVDVDTARDLEQRERVTMGRKTSASDTSPNSISL